MRSWLNGEYVILSGASGGIGRELTKILITRYGAKVIGIGRSEEKMLSLRQELGELSPAFSYRLFDVSERAAWTAFKEELLQNGIRPALLINNAGSFPPLTPALRIPAQTFENIMRINFLSAVYAIEALSPLLHLEGKRTPAIVNVSSSAALCTVVGSAAYTASKCALKGYTEALQLEEKGKKYVGIIYPGTTATDLFREDENVRESAMNKIACPSAKMAKKMARRIHRRKKRSVLGWDAKMMCFAAKLMPVKGPALVRWVMKKSKSKAFSNVFEQKKK